MEGGSVYARLDNSIRYIIQILGRSKVKLEFAMSTDSTPSQMINHKIIITFLSLFKLTLDN